MASAREVEVDRPSEVEYHPNGGHGHRETLIPGIDAFGYRFGHVSIHQNPVQLRHSLLLSSALHLALVLVTRGPLVRLESAALRQIPAAPAALQVTWQAATAAVMLVPMPATATPAGGAIPAGAPATGASRSGGGEARPARFLAEPDLSVLEEITVIGRGSVRLGLLVSTLGTVDAVRVLAADPVPEPLLQALQERLRQTRLEPARDADGHAVRSELVITVGFEPAMELLGPER